MEENMRIVNRKTFLEQPAGTLYSKYQPIIMEDLCIKGESLITESSNDFYYQPLNDSIECHSSEEYHDLFEAAQKHNKSLEMNFNSEYRDGLFDEDQLFAIWEALDLDKLIVRLHQARNR